MGKFYQFNLVELVLADQSAGILAVGTGFSPETGSIGRITDRQLRCLQDFAAVNIGYRNFSRRYQEIINPFQMEEIILKLRQLTGAVMLSLFTIKGGSISI